MDLQSAPAVDTVRVFSRPGFGPAAVSVLASTDGAAWSVLATATLTNAEGPHMMLFPPAPARWVRLRSTGTYSAANVQVEEFEVYAPAAGATGR